MIVRTGFRKLWVHVITADKSVDYDDLGGRTSWQPDVVAMG